MYIPYTTLFLTKNLFSQQIPSSHPFLVTWYFSRASHNTILLQILGGRMHGPSPPQIWGGRPPAPKSPPMAMGMFAEVVLHPKCAESALSDMAAALHGKYLSVHSIF